MIGYRRCEHCAHSRDAYGALLCVAGVLPRYTAHVREKDGICGPDAKLFKQIGESSEAKSNP